jgi:16S rRNA (adenine1518-N6/adenine1519-N6)-dimethyltransferase
VFSSQAKTVIRACFQQRRKQIGALLRAQLPDRAPEWRELLAGAGLSEKSRPEEIPVEWWVRFSALCPALA